MKLPFALWGVAYLVYIGYLLYFPVAAIIEDRLPPIACVILACEQVSSHDLVPKSLENTALV